MPRPICPSREDLYAFSVGTLDDGRAETVTAHLAACGQCQDTLQSLDDAGDTLLSQLRRPLIASPFGREPEQKRALARAKAIKAAPPAVAGQPAQAARAGQGPRQHAGAAESFDPYYHWLGIPPERQPPDHYCLLGLRPFEDDRVVIESAVEQRITHLRTFHLGKYSDYSQKLLNQVATAKVCLLDAKKKADYDGKLREKLDTARPGPASGPTAAAPALEVPGRVGEYELLEKLGEGGMGVVFKALQTKLGRVVALKALNQRRLADPHAVARFEREMRAVGGLNHPNIVQAYDAREIGPMRLLVMEFVEGTDLGRLAEKCGPLPVADACELARQTALGLQYAHEHRLVHRDIKPSNLMLSVARGPLSVAEGHGQRTTDNGQSPVVKILDLGLARFQAEQAAGEEVTGAGEAMGTLDYMAPEQFLDSRAVDIRADIYSLGCTLYKLLAGRAPFAGPEHARPVDKMAAHTGKPVPPIFQFRNDLPPALVQLLDRMLAKRPEDRPATPGEVALLLAPMAAGADLRSLLAKAEGKLAVPAAPKPAPPRAKAAPPRPATVLRLTDRKPPKPLVSRLVQRLRSRPRLAAAVGAAALLLAVALGIVVRIRHKDGQETVIHLPEGSQVVVEPDRVAPGPVPTPRPVPKPPLAKPVPQPEMHDVSPLPVAPEAAGISTVEDSEGNLKGDVERKFMDIVKASIQKKDGRWYFTVVTAAPFPDAGEMAGGKRVDFIFPLDTDLDRATGQARGNDINIHLTLSEKGWSFAFLGQSQELAQIHPKDRGRGGEIAADGKTVTLSFAEDTLPLPDHFDWRVHAMTGHAPAWLPNTFNPPTARRTFGPLGGAPNPSPLPVAPEAAGISAVEDAEGNLTGDTERKFMDIVKASIQKKDGRWHFTVVTAAPFPDARDMAGGKRVDFIFLLDTDLNPETGMAWGNERNVSLFLRETGWSFAPHNPPPGPDRVRPKDRLERPEITATGSTVTLSLPEDHLPLPERFQWRVHAMTGNAPTWLPKTFNPPTERRLWSTRPSGPAEQGPSQRWPEIKDRAPASLQSEWAAHGGEPIALRNAARVLPKFVLDTKAKGVVSLAFSPVQCTLAVSASDGKVRFFNMTSGDELPKSLQAEGFPWSIAFTPDGKRLFASGQRLDLGRHVAQVWELATGERRWIEAMHSQDVNAVLISADGLLGATLARDRSLHLWDATSGKVLRTLENLDSAARPAFSPDGKLLATATVAGSNREDVNLWKVADGTLRRSMPGHRGTIHCLEFSPDGRLLATAAHDGTIRLWDVATGEPAGVLQREPRSDGFGAVVFSADGSMLISGGYDNTVQFWDAANRKLVRTEQVGGAPALARSPDGSMIASGSFSGGTVTVWALSTEKPKAGER